VYIHVCTYMTAIPYTVKVTTGPEKSMGTDSNVYANIIGTRRRETGKQFLELMQKKAFLPGAVDTFSLEAIDVGDVKQIEVDSSSTIFLFCTVKISVYPRIFCGEFSFSLTELVSYTFVFVNRRYGLHYSVDLRIQTWALYKPRFH